MEDEKHGKGLSKEEREHLAWVAIILGGCMLVWFDLGPVLLRLWTGLRPV